MGDQTEKQILSLYLPIYDMRYHVYCTCVIVNFLLHGVFCCKNNVLSQLKKAGVFAKNVIIYKCKNKYLLGEKK